MNKLLAIAIVAALAACSNDAPAPGADAATTSPTPTATQAAAADTAIKLGMVFIDADPKLAAGGVIVRGSLKVGDTLSLLTSDGRTVPVRIDEIRSDDSNELVQEAHAPAGVFLTFSADRAGQAGSDNVLIATGSFPDFAAAKAFLDGAQPDDKPQVTDQQREARWGEATFAVDGRAVRVPDPGTMLRPGLLSSDDLFAFTWDNGQMSSPTRPTDAADAHRFVERVAADTPVLLSVNAGINDSDGGVLVVDLWLPETKLGDFATLPRTFEFKGDPQALPTKERVNVVIQDGDQYFDASEATVTITAFDAAAGKVEGTFSAIGVARPKDLFAGRYDTAQTRSITDGRFSIDRNRQ